MKLTTEVDGTQWRDFVNQSPRGNIFQTPEMADVYKDTLSYDPVSLFALEKGEIQGLALAHLIWNGKGMMKKFSTRCILQGGPICRSAEVGRALLGRLDELVRRRALYSEIRNLWEFEDPFSQFKSTGYVFEPHMNYLLDLRVGEEGLWLAIAKGRRRGVRKGEKAGLEFSELSDKEQLPVFYKILEETYSDVRIPLADKSLFTAAYKNLNPLQEAKFFLCHTGGEPIACRVVLIHKKTMYDWYAGFLRDQRTTRPNDFLVWNILKWGVKNGYEVFDFGGAGSPKEEYGPREFKRSFGGELVEPGRLKKVYKPRQLWITNKAFRFCRRFT
ncbi:MAG: GNAT family N-acetyltransferase [Thermoplasmata archaeon]|nr:GNAT family N-acetyltransferase [Thermoplasmata archaeon]